ncbi:MAG: hypothetical protein MEQ07_10810 [Aquimonas sp.]|nr:hypothetical protein [Aquimonas sp.]
MKQRSIASVEEAIALEHAVATSAERALAQIIELHDPADALRTLWEMKFRPIGCDPLDSEAPLNVIEQLNQTFTYIASARAAVMLFQLHPRLAPFTLNLGNIGGSDIESGFSGQLACEVFAAVNTSNNQKLNKDLAKVAATGAEHKYVFFMCPGVAAGRQTRLERLPGVQVWAVGDLHER